MGTSFETVHSKSIMREDEFQVQGVVATSCLQADQSVSSKVPHNDGVPALGDETAETCLQLTSSKLEPTSTSSSSLPIEPSSQLAGSLDPAGPADDESAGNSASTDALRALAPLSRPDVGLTGQDPVEASDFQWYQTSNASVVGGTYSTLTDHNQAQRNSFALKEADLPSAQEDIPQEDEIQAGAISKSRVMGKHATSQCTAGDEAFRQSDKYEDTATLRYGDTDPVPHSTVCIPWTGSKADSDRHIYRASDNPHAGSPSESNASGVPVLDTPPDIDQWPNTPAVAQDTGAGTFGDERLNNGAEEGCIAVACDDECETENLDHGIEWTTGSSRNHHVGKVIDDHIAQDNDDQSGYKTTGAPPALQDVDLDQTSECSSDAVLQMHGSLELMENASCNAAANKLTRDDNALGTPLHARHMSHRSETSEVRFKQIALESDSRFASVQVYTSLRLNRSLVVCPHLQLCLLVAHAGRLGSE